MKLSLRLLSSIVQRRPFYVTTPIFYVNAEPHIGHLYTAVVADAVQRFEKLTNPHYDIIFSTGTDEHGMKVQQAAAAAGLPPARYCDEISQLYRRLFDDYGVQYTDFIRTTDEKHKAAVTHFWRELVSREAVYKARYSGWYCAADETFVPLAQLANVQRGGETVKVSLESGHPVEWTEEDNYMFRLSEYREHLQRWLDTEGVIVPSKFQSSLRSSLLGATHLADISVSRPASRVHWAIPVPDDPSQSIYVWVDALVNYLTAAGYPDPGSMRARGRPWPADLHVVGKDILKFHAVYWPALLMAAGLPLPRRLLAHAHWLRDGGKMGKSRGNALAPAAVAGGATGDALRYVLLREATGADDANFSESKFMNICNSELADTLGNLLSRSLAMRRPPRTLPAYRRPPAVDADPSEAEVMDKVERLADVCHEHYSDFQFYKAADAIIQALHAANRHFEAKRPWQLRDEPAALDAVLHVTWEALRVAGTLLQPLVPGLAGRLLDQLGVPLGSRLWADAEPAWRTGDAGRALAAPEKYVLFQRMQRERQAPREKTDKKGTPKKTVAA